MRTSLANRIAAACITLAIATGCSKLLPSKPAASAAASYAISIVSGNGQSGVAGNTLPYALVAKVVDTTTNLPADGVNVDWTVVTGSGSLENVYSRTARDGTAGAELAVGTTAGSNSVTATVHDQSTAVATFTAMGTIGAADSAHSSIVGSGPVENDGINTSAITITLRDTHSNPLTGITPTFTASGSANTYGACSVTSSLGVSNCTLASTTAETKILTIRTPSTIVGGTVVFAPGAAYGPYSTISGTTNVIANGTATSTVTITLQDANHVAASGIVPTFAATNTGSTNSYGTCSTTNASGSSTCTFTSTKAEVKTLSITSPVSFSSGSTVTFIHGPASSTTSTITGTGPVEPDGTSTSAISIALKDASGNPISGTVPTFSATNTGTTNTYGACTSTDAAGLSTCHLSSTTAETKTLSLTAPAAFAGGTVVFAPSAAVAANSSIAGTSTVVADGTATSTVTITLKDSNNVPVGGIVPTFSATNTGSGNTYGTCSSTNTSGVSTCTLASTKAETKTLSLASPVTLTGSTVTFIAGPLSAATSTITGTGPTVADGSASSGITATLLDANSNPISGIVPTFAATDTGSHNTYQVCSSSNASGVSTCTMKSTKAEVKTLSLVTPGTSTGGTVTFIHGAAVIANSSITGTGPVESDGTSPSTITVTLMDANNNPVNATVPTFSATDTGSTNAYGTCSSSTTAGVSTCTLTSTHPETKTLSLTAPVAMAGGTVVFNTGGASVANSSITGTGPVSANGSATSTVTITLKDSSNIAIPGVVPTFTATDTNNTNVYGACSPTSAAGVSTCSLASGRAEVKTLSLASPITLSGGTVTFTNGTASAANSQITGTGPVVANGTATSTITIVLYDSSNNPVAGITPTFSATDTGTTNVYGACSATTASGSSTCTLKSTKAETKILSIVSPVNVASGTVSFTPQAPMAANSSITGTGPVASDGVASSTVTITLRDTNNNPVPGTVPTFTATNTGNTNVMSTCSTSNTSGVSTCTLKSTHSEVKTLSIATPVTLAGGTVTFGAAAASATTTTITASGPVNADGVAASTVTITLRDVNSNPIAGTVPTFSATDTGSTNAYGTCSSSNASGVSTCTLKSTRGETKTLSLVSPVAVTGGTVVFTQVASTTYTTITGTGPVVANGTATSTITITVKDYSNTAMAGVTPTFSATDTGSTNAYTLCSSTNASGVSTCTLKSSHAETKTLTLSTPISLTGGTVVFSAAPASATTTTITGTGPVSADGTASSTITITLLDANSNPVVGTVPTFSATNTGTTNVYGTCSSSNASGVSTCTLKSTKAETKTLSLTAPVAVTGGTVVFNQLANSSYTTITGTGSVLANGTAASTVTITLKDYTNTAIAGIVPTFSATDTGSTNIYGACSTSSASGVSTCTLKSAKAETKTLQLTSPITMSGGTVVFTQVASPSYTTITGTGPVNADGTSASTITITLKDYANTAIVGTVPTFSATNTGTSNAYGTCSSSNSSGVSTCTLKSNNAETKTLSLTAPISMTGGTVVFSAVPSATYTTITGTTSIAANGVASSTVTITLKDNSNTGIAGVTPTFSATNTNTTNVYGTCSATSASGVSTCTLKSTYAETKTLQLTAPLSLTGGTVQFVQAASASYTTITGSGPVNADGASASTVTITLKDYSNLAMAGTVPTFSATNTGTTNVYGTCSSSNASGVSTCTLKSSKAEVKTLSLATPVAVTGGTVTFSQVASASNSTITGTGSVAANNAATSTITITIKDYSSAAVIGVTPSFSATDTNSTNVYGTCAATNASGVSTCTLKSSYAETKTLSITGPVNVTGGTVVFTQTASTTYTTVSATGPTTANGIASSTITITLKDYSNVAISGVTPVYTATGTGNTVGSCSSSNASGVSTCSLKSTVAGTKSISVTSPVSMPSAASAVFN